MKFSEHLQNIEQSETFKFFALIKEKIATGADVTPLVAGELDEPTPAHIAEAGIQAIKSGKTKYTLNNGILELRQAICEKFKTDNNLTYSPNQILVSNGGKHALFNCLYSLLGHDDEVILFAPYYSSYPEMIKLTGAKPIIVDTIQNGSIPTSKMIESAITKKTKAIIINSPSNPTGIVYDRSTLVEITKLVKKHSLWLISDEIYEKIIFPPFKHFCPLSVNSDIIDQTIILNGFSKTYSMTGWRIGYAAGPKELIEKAALVQSQTTSNASSISQYAALEALNSDDAFILTIIPKLLAKRDRAIEILSKLEDIEIIKPDGAFYLFVKVSAFYQKDSIDNSTKLAIYLLEKHNVGVVPGVAFGADDYIRISFAPSMDKIENGVQQIVNGLQTLCLIPKN